MPSVVSGFEYDLFISYRQKDNKGDHWVSGFVKALKDELDAAFKDELNIYFDENPHDGLHEMHDVDGSLKEKIKCLIFIPILSRTYCDPQSFAWQHEFLPFRDFASNDAFGLKVKLANGNVASRILPVRIYELSQEDTSLFETETKGPIRAVDFVFKSAGVNRPLLPSDKKEDNFAHVVYRDQVNKIANVIGDIIVSMRKPPQLSANPTEKKQANFTPSPTSSKKRIWVSLLSVLFVVAGLWMAYKFMGGTQQPTEEVVDKSIVVLPFADMSPNKDQEYFSDGISEELITLLSKVPELKVIAPTSAFSFKGKNVDNRTIGETLKVSHLLEGGVQKSGNKLRVTVKLKRASDDLLLWSEKYNRDLDEVFKVQDEIAEAVVEKLKITLLGKLSTTKSSNMEAYNLLLQGKYVIARGEPGYTKKALDLYEQALALDSTDARLWADLSFVYSEMTWEDPYSARQLILEAKEAAEKAILLDDKSAEGHASMGEALLLDWNWKESENEFKKAYTISPEFYRISQLYRCIGQVEEAVLINQKATELDPVNASIWQTLAVLLYYSKRYDEALACVQKTHDISPQYILIHSLTGYIYLQQGRYNEAIIEFEKETIENWKNMGLSATYFATNHKTKSDSLLNEITQNTKTLNYLKAELYAFRGEEDKAFESLDKAYKIKHPYLTTIKSDPFLKNITGDPRYKALLKKMNLPLD